MAEIGAGLILPHTSGIVIGCGAKVGRYCLILQQVTLGESYRFGDEGLYPTVGNRCVVGAGAKVLGPIHVGHSCLIGANSVVVQDVPPESVAAGIPARVIRSARDVVQA